MIIEYVYKHPKHGVSDFTNNYITPLLDELTNENKDIMIMGDFNINLITYNDDKNTGNFLDTMFSQSFLPYITTPTRIARNTKTLLDNIYYRKLKFKTDLVKINWDGFCLHSNPNDALAYFLKS